MNLTKEMEECNHPQERRIEDGTCVDCGWNMWQTYYKEIVLNSSWNHPVVTVGEEQVDPHKVKILIDGKLYDLKLSIGRMSQCGHGMSMPSHFYYYLEDRGWIKKIDQGIYEGYITQ